MPLRRRARRHRRRAAGTEAPPVKTARGPSSQYHCTGPGLLRRACGPSPCDVPLAPPLMCARGPAPPGPSDEPLAPTAAPHWPGPRRRAFGPARRRRAGRACGPAPVRAFGPALRAVRPGPRTVLAWPGPLPTWFRPGSAPLRPSFPRVPIELCASSERVPSEFRMSFEGCHHGESRTSPGRVPGESRSSSGRVPSEFRAPPAGFRSSSDCGPGPRLLSGQFRGSSERDPPKFSTCPNEFRPCSARVLGAFRRGCVPASRANKFCGSSGRLPVANSTQVGGAGAAPRVPVEFRSKFRAVPERVPTEFRAGSGPVPSEFQNGPGGVPLESQSSSARVASGGRAEQVPIEFRDCSERVPSGFRARPARVPTEFRPGSTGSPPVPREPRGNTVPGPSPCPPAAGEAVTAAPHFPRPLPRCMRDPRPCLRARFLPEPAG